MTQFSLPAAGTGPSTMPGETYYGFSLVPVDDISCWMYCYAWNPDRNLGNKEREKLATVGHGIIAEVDENYMPVRNRSNDYMIDREVQRTSPTPVFKDSPSRTSWFSRARASSSTARERL